MLWLDDDVQNETIKNCLPLLCRADKQLIQQWIHQTPLQVFMVALPLLVLSGALYGATLGMWHGAEMSLYVAIKFPLAILATLIINCLINGLFGMVSGSGFSLRQSFQFLIIGFTIFSVILASLTPILAFMNLNTPKPGDPGMAQAYRVFIVTNVAIVSFAGVVAHHILLKHVRELATNRRAGTITFFLWISVNFFAGSQVTYLLRPFFGAPKLKVVFLRDDLFEGNFYEAVFYLLQYIT